MASSFDGETFSEALDGERLGTLLHRVEAFMQDGAWRTLDEIVAACGGTVASVSARLRDLRKQKFGGYIIERVRGEAPGLWLYRLVAAHDDDGIDPLQKIWDSEI